MVRICGFLLLVCALLALQTRADSEDERISKTLSTKDVDDIMEDRRNWLILLDAGQDGGAMVDAVEALASTVLVKYNVNAGVFDCGNKKNRKPCAALLGVQSGGGQPFPLRFISGKSTFNPYTKKGMRSNVAVEGIENDKAMEKWLLKHSLQTIVKVNSKTELDSAVEEGMAEGRNTIALFSEKSSISALYKQVCLRTASNTLCVSATSTTTSEEDGGDANWVTSILDSVGADFMPAVVAYSSGNSSLYSGDLKDADAIVEWALDLPTPIYSSPSADFASQSETISESTGDDTVENNKKDKNIGNNKKDNVKNERPVTTPSDAAKLIEKQENKAFIVAVVHEHTSELAGDKTWSTLIKRCEGAILPLAISCGTAANEINTDIVKEICNKKFTPRGSFVVVPYGEDGREEMLADMEDYTFTFDADSVGDALKSAVSLALDSLPDTVHSLPNTNHALDEFMSATLTSSAKAQGATGVSLIAISDKPAPPSFLKNVAAVYGVHVPIGFLSSPSADILARLGGVPVPSLVALFVQPGSESEDESDERVRLSVQPYLAEQFGPMRFKGVNSFAMNLLVHTGIKEIPGVFSIGNDGSVDTSSTEDVDTSSTRSSNTVTITTVNSPSSWEEECSTLFRGICVLSFYPPSDHNSYSTELLNTIKKLEASSVATSTFKFLSIDPSCQVAFSDVFGVSSDQVPALVAYSPSKSRYAKFRGQWVAASIKDFVIDVTSGRTSTGPLSDRPEMEVDCSVTGGDPIYEEEDAFDADLMAEILREEEEQKLARKREIEAEKQAAKDAKQAAKEEVERIKKKKKKKKKKDKSEL